ncbi:hypothetical protein ACIOWI_35805 [Streptomyces sp. NPDC087659]|uniref:hypothetical protein n=1 Tax=Streptomyces sp. NPDC087659 TaxID=3365801 RepID=UPI0038270D74
MPLFRLGRGSKARIQAINQLKAVLVLAQRMKQLTGQIDELKRRPTRFVEHHAQQLLVPTPSG